MRVPTVYSTYMGVNSPMHYGARSAHLQVSYGEAVLEKTRHRETPAKTGFHCRYFSMNFLGFSEWLATLGEFLCGKIILNFK